MREGSPVDGARASWLSAVALVLPLSLFAELLIVKTHHRPLAAVTYGCVAVVCWAVAEVVSRRVLDARVSAGRRRARKILWWCSAGSALLVLVRALL